MQKTQRATSQGQVEGAGQTGTEEGKQRALCCLHVEGIGFSWATDLSKEHWDGVLKLRGGKAVNVEPHGSRTRDLGFTGLP